MKQRDGEEMAGRQARTEVTVAADRTRVRELGRRLSPCFTLTRLCSPRRQSPHFPRLLL